MDMNYFVYVNDFIGVKTNLEKFSWSFGATPPKSSSIDYEKCRFKLELEVCNDRDIFSENKIENFPEKFRHYHTKKNEGKLFFEKIYFKRFKLSYFISVEGRTIKAKVGKNYYNFIKYKIMNIYPIWYVLFDLVSALLVNDGFLPLYSSVVDFEGYGAVVMLAAPNTGKTYTALNLCKKYGGRLLSEDMALTDGTYVWPAQWTNSYRSYDDKLNQYIDKLNREINPASIRNVFILEKSEKKMEIEILDSIKKLLILNDYCVGYKSSPIVNILAYYSDGISLDKLYMNERRIFEKMIDKKKNYIINTDSGTNFYQNIIDTIKSIMF